MVKKNDLKGHRFGRLTVLNDIGKRSSTGKILWQCVCDCGCIAFVRGDHLKPGKISSCGCLNKAKRQERFKNLTGYENGNFKVLQKVGSKNQRVMWSCECKHCGNLVELHSNAIKKNMSCGCLKQSSSKEYMDSIRDVESLKSTKPTKKSTTGIRGVYFNKRRKKYTAFINVNKKTLYLGYSKDLQGAAKLRHDAEREFWDKELNSSLSSRQSNNKRY